MNDILIIVEGQSEQSFLRSVLAPYLGEYSCYVTAQLIGASGHKGGNVSFARFSKNVGISLKQRSNTYISSMLDFFKLDTDWPGMDELQMARKSGRILDKNNLSEILEKHTLEKLREMFPEYDVLSRVLPYFSMHEFEALLFSDISKLSDGLGGHSQKLHNILASYGGDPEQINSDPSKAPSKVLKCLSPKYKKVLQGTSIATSIGIPKMQSKCTCFNNWVTRLLEFS